MPSPPPPPQLADAIGKRVVVRRRLGIEAGRPLYGDVLGVLLSWSDGVAAVRRDDDGTTERIAEADIVAGKPIPPRPPRRARRYRQAEGEGNGSDAASEDDPTRPSSQE